MPIIDLCSRELISVERNASLQFAAQLMKKHHVGGLVVVETNGFSKPVGIITDRDIVLNVVADKLPFDTKVGAIMSNNVVSIQAKTGIAEAVEAMERARVRRMVVVDSLGNACGLVSADDILRLIAKEINGLGNLYQKQVQDEPFIQRHQKSFLTI
ncbi:MAG: CBS domain-containing protein [Pseudobdellovibrio sp.]